MHLVLSNLFLRLVLCILSYAYGAMYIVLCFSFYASTSHSVLCISFYASDSMHQVLCLISCSLAFHSTYSLNFIQCISMLHLITYISYYAFHFLHPDLLVSFYSSLSMHFILIKTVKLLLKLVGDRPTN